MKKLLAGMALLMVSSVVFADVPRMAVMSLENKSGYRGHAMDLGTGMADMLVTGFVNSKKFRLVERAELDKVITEQKLGASGIITAQTAAELGKILGVRYMVIGSVNEFGTSSNKVGAFGVGLVNHSAVAGLDIRVIDTTSAEIVAAATGQGKKSTQGVNISNSDILPTNVGIGSDKFNSSLIGKASRDAVDDAVSKVVKALGGAWKGTIIKVSEDGTVAINGGANVDVKAGEVFKVIRKGEELIDPGTGESLGSEDTVIGEIKVTEVKEKYSNAKVVSGKDIQKNDKIEKK